MTHIRPLTETPETVTLSRADFEAMMEEIEDAEDRLAVLEDCLNDREPEHRRHLLTMAETMRVIDGESPIRVWREKRALTVTQLAAASGMPDDDLIGVETGAPVTDSVLHRLGAVLGVPSDQLKPVAVAP